MYTNNQTSNLKLFTLDLAQFLCTKFHVKKKNQQAFLLASQLDSAIGNHPETNTHHSNRNMNIDLIAFTQDDQEGYITLHVSGDFIAGHKEQFVNLFHEWFNSTSLCINAGSCNIIFHNSHHNISKWIETIGWDNTYVLNDSLIYIFYKDSDENIFGYSASAVCYRSVLSALAEHCIEPEDAFELLANQTSFIEHQTALYCCENASYISKQPISNITNLFNNNYAQALQYVAMYDERKAEWQFGIWGSKHIGIQDNWPEAYTINHPNYLLSSAVDFADCPASKQKQALIAKEGKGSIKYQLRSNLPHILECAELAHGEFYDVDAMDDDHPKNHPSINFLCDWWNTNAPEEMRCASNFRIYIYDYYDNHLISFINEAEPLIPVECIMDCKSLALFGDNIIVVFLKDLDSSEDGNCYDAAGDIYHFASTDKYYETIDTFECLDNLRDLYLDSNNNEGAWDE